MEFLNVKSNSLETVETLWALGGLGELTELQVEGNPLCTADSDYRARVGKVLMKLEVLDGVSNLCKGWGNFEILASLIARLGWLAFLP